MSTFINEDFLLNSSFAKDLYHNHAAKMPIIDFHSHLSPEMIAKDHKFKSITELWLAGDHYKWRAERACGVDEKYITGTANDKKKFLKWAETVPNTMMNPLYHWTHLELKTAFGIDEVLNARTAQKIYDKCNELLQLPEYSVRGLLRKYKVEVLCTTDDPIDDLNWHKQIAESDFEIKVLPAWRPDKAYAVDNVPEYLKYLEKLSKASGVEITSYDSLVEALKVRHDYFAENGCRLADHGITNFEFSPCTRSELAIVFYKLMLGYSLNKDEKSLFVTNLLIDLAKMNAEKGWVQQFHFGPLRNNNSRMFELLGPDTGFDSMGDGLNAENMSKFLDYLSKESLLTKTILYNINPRDNAMVAAMAANFNDSSCRGKMQLGAAWWFNDHIEGMLNQLKTVSQQGLLSVFVGMTTDSRSFVSFPRHEYFRRILCDYLGDAMQKGLLPESEKEHVAKIVDDISYYNSKNYFNF